MYMHSTIIVGRIVHESCFVITNHNCTINVLIGVCADFNSCSIVWILPPCVYLQSRVPLELSCQCMRHFEILHACLLQFLCTVCVMPLNPVILPLDVVMDPPAISPDATILSIPPNELLFIKRRLQISRLLLTLNAMKLVEPDLMIKAVAPLVATSENSIFKNYPCRRINICN